jgi:MOSC domain-containing protein YiiM
MTVEHIFISPEHNFVGHHGIEPGDAPAIKVDEVECVAGSGLRGDRYFDFKENYKGQVTFFSMEVYEDVCARFQAADLPPSIFRRNILVRGVDLNSLIGHEFEIQGVKFAGTQEAAPCHWMNHVFADGAEEALRGRGGLRARILNDGILRCGAA